MDFKEKVQKVQLEIKAPKDLYNSFGKYNYRNAESILEAFKPYGDKYKLVLTVGDEMVEIGGRIYVKATANLMDCESEQALSNSAYARESEDKKGMDDSQITGTASSYARKYALNGLFLLDDTKDADSDEYHHQTTRTNKTSGITPQQLGKIKAELLRTGIKEESVCQRYGVSRLEELTSEQADKAIKCLGKSGGNGNAGSV